MFAKALVQLVATGYLGSLTLFCPLLTAVDGRSIFITHAQFELQWEVTHHTSQGCLLSVGSPTIMNYDGQSVAIFEHHEASFAIINQHQPSDTQIDKHHLDSAAIIPSSRHYLTIISPFLDHHS